MLCFVPGTFSVKNVVPTPEGGSSKVKLKVRLNIHGIFNASNAQLVEKLPATAEPEAEAEAEAETELMDTSEGKKNGNEQKVDGTEEV